MLFRSRSQRASNRAVPLVALTEALRSEDSVGKNGGGLDRVVDAVDRRERPPHSVDVVGLLESVVLVPHGAVEDDREFQRGAPQCSSR
jgi:hypothetical protein